MQDCKTPISNFLEQYGNSDITRFHMPGHKGAGALWDFERFDITEVKGADALYEAEGIIAESEAVATELFGTARTLFSTEGSSQCIRAMLHLIATTCETEKPLILAARNVHKAFIYGAALLDMDVEWLWPEGDSRSLCSCKISAEMLEKQLETMERTPEAVYVTSPDYVGGLADIRGLAEVCHRHGVLLAVDNAHGAYLHFLEQSLHPIDLGADICCDSAHKTLPVLTGGAYLQISKQAPANFADDAKQAMEIFGSTSPSYLIMASLDRCNRYLAHSYRERLAKTCVKLQQIRSQLREKGWKVEETDPLRITIHAPVGVSGIELAEQLRAHAIECEYADPEFLVLMATPENSDHDFAKLLAALGDNQRPYEDREPLPFAKSTSAMSIRKALFSKHEIVPLDSALGRICAAPTVSCPPAIPVAVPGEIIGETALSICRHYGFEHIAVVK